MPLAWLEVENGPDVGYNIRRDETGCIAAGVSRCLTAADEPDER